MKRKKRIKSVIFSAWSGLHSPFTHLKLWRKYLCTLIFISKLLPHSCSSCSEKALGSSSGSLLRLWQNRFPNSGYRLHGKLGEQQKFQCYNLEIFSKLEGSSQRKVTQLSPFLCYTGLGNLKRCSRFRSVPGSTEWLLTTPPACLVFL